MVKLTWPAVLVLAAAACGGSTSNGSGGSGGTTSGGSGATGGVSASGGTTGSGGAPGGGGGGTTACPPLAFCNWCNGKTVTDPNGCQHFECPNGVDPCVTNPCSGPSDCPANQACGPDELCWPAGSCVLDGCGAGGATACGCSWICPDGSTQEVSCDNANNCTCSVGGSIVASCGSSNGPLDCETGACCGLPPFN
jgi:hypothetical protein